MQEACIRGREKGRGQRTTDGTQTAWRHYDVRQCPSVTHCCSSHWDKLMMSLRCGWLQPRASS